MKVKLKIDTEDPASSRELLKLALRDQMFNALFDLSLGFSDYAERSGVLKEGKSSLKLHEIYDVINFVLKDNNLSVSLLEDLS